MDSIPSPTHSASQPDDNIDYETHRAGDKTWQHQDLRKAEFKEHIIPTIIDLFENPCVYNMAKAYLESRPVDSYKFTSDNIAKLGFTDTKTDVLLGQLKAQETNDDPPRRTVLDVALASIAFLQHPDTIGSVTPRVVIDLTDDDSDAHDHTQTPSAQCEATRPHKRAKVVVSTDYPTDNFVMLNTAAREGDLDRFQHFLDGLRVGDKANRTALLNTLIRTACTANRLPILAYMRTSVMNEKDLADCASHVLACALDEDRTALLIHLRDDWELPHGVIASLLRDQFASWCKHTTAVRKLCALQGVWNISHHPLYTSSSYVHYNLLLHMLREACCHNAHPDAPCPRVKVIRELYKLWGTVLSKIITSSDGYGCLVRVCTAGCADLIDEFHAHWGLSAEVFRSEHCEKLLSHACEHNYVNIVRHLKRVFELDIELLLPFVSHACANGAVNLLMYIHEEWHLTPAHIRRNDNAALREACRHNQVAIVRILRERFGLTRADALHSPLTTFREDAFNITLLKGHTSILQEFKSWDITLADLRQLPLKIWQNTLFEDYRSLYTELQDQWGFRLVDLCYKHHTST